MKQFKNSTLAVLMVMVIFFSMQFLKKYQAHDLTNELQQLARQGFQVQTPALFTNCVGKSTMPDLACTPGALVPHVLRGDLCKRGYTSSVKAVTSKTKDAIFAAYNIPENIQNNYTIDRFVAVALGGSNDMANLWPQLVKGERSASHKNRVESFLYDQLCAGKLSMQEVQELGSRQWVMVYDLIK